MVYSFVRFKKDQHTKILSKGQKLPKNLRYITQLDAFGNACGTIAAIHAVANSNVPIGKGLLASFIQATEGMDSIKRGKALFNHPAIRELSDSCARSEGASTRCPGADEKV